MSNIKTSDDFVESPSKSFAWFSILLGILGWAAAFALTLERIHVASNPNATLSCDMNVFISCKSVMLTAQAKLFGFPNPLIGLAAFVAPIFVGFAVLAGAQFKQWFWRVYMVGLALGFVFVLWLFTQSTFVIHVLCPYCMVAWVAMIPLFWRTFIWAGAEGIIDVPVRLVGLFVRSQDISWVYSLATELLAAISIIISFWSSWHLLLG
ncbi:MAG: vitamin K epoxide reductase family protein [Micrococcales bacterium]